MDGAKPRFVFYTAGTGGILVGVVLFKPRCSDWCSEFHVKAFLLLIITPHVVFTAEFRQTFLVTWVARRTFWWLTDWTSFLLRFHQSECLQLTGDWLLSYPMPFAMCFCAPGVWSLHAQCFLKWCLEILLRLTPQFLPSSTCRYSRRCFLIARLLGMVCWNMSKIILVRFQSSSCSMTNSTCSLYHEWTGIFAQFWI